MSKNPNQKLKLLYLYQILLQRTDENHKLTTDELRAALERGGITAERKSIYSDIEALQNFGLDVICQRGAGGGYYVASREFELPELKLLVDAIQCSRFITEKKSNELIGKIEHLTSDHEAHTLQRQVYVSERVKTLNEQIYYNIDALHAAISNDVQITFRYFNWVLNFSASPRIHQLKRDIFQFFDVHFYTFLIRMQALWPPKPSELEMATLIGISTALFGVISRSHSGSGSL